MDLTYTQTLLGAAILLVGIATGCLAMLLGYWTGRKTRSPHEPVFPKRQKEKPVSTGPGIDVDIFQAAMSGILDEEQGDE